MKHAVHFYSQKIADIYWTTCIEQKRKAQFIRNSVNAVTFFMTLKNLIAYAGRFKVPVIFFSLSHFIYITNKKK